MDQHGDYSSDCEVPKWVTEGSQHSSESEPVRPEDQFPPCVSNSLAVRTSVVDYDSSNFVGSLERSPGVDLETKYGNDRGLVTVPRRYDPVQAYPIRVRGKIYAMDYGLRKGSSMTSAVSYLKRQNKAWAAGGCSIVSDGLTHVDKKLSDLYVSPPLCVYTALSIREVGLMSLSDREAWSPLFDASLTTPRRYGLYGTIMDNATVDMRPYEESDTYEVRSDPHSRTLRESWSGFIDPSYTVASQDAGRIRSLVHRVSIRVATIELLERMEHIAAIIDQGTLRRRGTEGWTVYFMGLVYDVPESVIDEVAKLWRSMGGRNTPSVHIFRASRLMTVSAVSGCLMRPLSILEDVTCRYSSDTLWVDSMVFNSRGLRQALGLTANVPTNPMEYVRTQVLLFPYTLHDAVPRPTLATIMSTQAVCRPSVSLMSTVTPVSSSLPIVRTPLMDAVCASSARVSYFDVPGIDLIVLFANFKDTYEDSVILSSLVNEEEVFATISTVAHPVPSRAKGVRVGSTLNPATYEWWRPADEGTVLQVKYGSTKERYVIAEMHSKGVRVGDKIATQHGQKQTVSRVIEHELMPTCVDTASGLTFRPHIVMASSSIHNRLTPGQIYEARAGALANNVATFSLRGEHINHVTTLLGSDSRYLPKSECNFTGIGSREYVVSSLSGDRTPCKADYGICRFWSLAHLARDKQHFSSHVPSTPQGPTGRLMGSSVRIGEGELSAMMSKGWINAVSEMLDSSDQAVVSVCSSCRRLGILCDCPPPLPSTTDVVVRSGLTRLDVIRAVYTSNMEIARRGGAGEGECGEGGDDSDNSLTDDISENSLATEVTGESGHDAGRRKSDRVVGTSFKYEF